MIVYSSALFSFASLYTKSNRKLKVQRNMEAKQVTVIRSAEKKGTVTANSEYIFHFSGYPARENVGLYEGHFKNPGKDTGLHYHKQMTEIFTVLEGEFFFNTPAKEYILQPNDTIIIPPTAIHGFRAKLPDSRVQFVFTGNKDREGFFIGLAKIINGEITLTAEESEAFYNSFDQYSVK
jgi:quercetin dioxygenase-like cupin family protein